METKSLKFWNKTNLKEAIENYTEIIEKLLIIKRVNLDNQLQKIGHLNGYLQGKNCEISQNTKTKEYVLTLEKKPHYNIKIEFKTQHELNEKLNKKIKENEITLNKLSELKKNENYFVTLKYTLEKIEELNNSLP